MMRDSNPGSMPYHSKQFVNDVKLGQFCLAKEQVSSLNDYVDIKPNDEEAIHASS